MGLLRAIGLLGTLTTLAIGMYLYSMQVKTMQPSVAVAATLEASASTPDETALISGVKMDLLSIANAERGYMALQGSYASMDELAAGGYLPVRHDRPPYMYDVSVTPAGFSATATRATKGSPTQLWITESMEVQSSD